jgi:pSer/pThr/pTyr-binding forkhead associated (FHA) protein
VARGVSAGDAPEQIVGAPVVSIAATAAEPARLTQCVRCQGHCIKGAKYCRYCGASLDEPGAAAALPLPPEGLTAGDREAPTVAEPLRKRADMDTKPSGALSPADVAMIIGAGKAAPSTTVADALPDTPDFALVFPVQGKGSKDELASPATESKPAAPTLSSPASALIPESEPVSEPRAQVNVTSARAPSSLLVVIAEDGSEGKVFPLPNRALDIGRTEGDIVLPDDLYVSPRHARLRPEGAGWVLRDLDSTNGIYVRIRKPHVLQDGDLLLLGLEVLQFQTVNHAERGLGHASQHGTLLFGSPLTSRRARLCQRTVEGVSRDVYHLFRDETVIGREVGDLVFTADPFLSRRHAVIRRNVATGDFSLVDLDSSNGTYLAIRGDTTLLHGDLVRIGQHLFRLDLA